MLKIPKMSNGKPFKINSPYLHGSRSEPEIVMPLGTINEAVKQALNESAKHETQITFKLNGEQIYKKTGGD
jgi:hypothetical protein